MTDTAVVDTSPLIYLARIDALDLLRLVARDVVAPVAVIDEIDVYGPDDPVALAVRASSWLRIVATPEIPPVVHAWDLGPGETAVLAWALAHAGAEAVIDDLSARRCAAALGVAVRGTLGLVILAKQRGIIPEARPVVERLRAAGMYLTEHVINRALALADE